MAGSRLWYGTKMRTDSTGKRPVGENDGDVVDDVCVAIGIEAGIFDSRGDEAVVRVVVV